jgi:hypothetical protein
MMLKILQERDQKIAELLDELADIYDLQVIYGLEDMGTIVSVEETIEGANKTVKFMKDHDCHYSIVELIKRPVREHNEK